MIIGCYFIIKKPICADTLINRSEFKIDTEVISALSPPITCMNLHSDGHDSDCVFPVCVVLALRLNLWAFWTGSLIMWSVSSLLSVVTTLWPHRSKLLICIHGWGVTAGARLLWITAGGERCTDTHTDVTYLSTWVTSEIEENSGQNLRNTS